MRTKLFAALGDGTALVAAIGFFFSVPLFAQTRVVDAVPAFAISSATPQLPSGTRLVARVALDGQPVTRMYTQSEYGRTYLYIMHGPYSLTTVDISKKQHPQVVDHAPGNVEPALYQELFEGGSVEVSPNWEVIAGIHTTGGRGMRSILESGDPDDARLLGAFGPGYANLADRDHRLVFFASPAQLLVVQDNRMTAIDFITN